MNKKFCLRDDVYLVKGARRGAIYDLNTGEVYSLNEQAVQVLDLALEGQTPEEIGLVVPDLGIGGVFELLEALVIMELGTMVRRASSPFKSYRDLPRPTPQLHFAWLELMNGCNLHCIHCYAGSAPYKIGTEKMTVSDWKGNMKKVVHRGRTRVQGTNGGAQLCCMSGSITIRATANWQWSMSKGSW